MAQTVKATLSGLLEQCQDGTKTQRRCGGGVGSGRVGAGGSELSTLNLREGQHKTGAVLVLQTACKSPFSSPVMTREQNKTICSSYSLPEPFSIV